jgi:hypothetical protein
VCRLAWREFAYHTILPGFLFFRQKIKNGNSTSNSLEWDIGIAEVTNGLSGFSS